MKDITKKYSNGEVTVVWKPLYKEKAPAYAEAFSTTLVKASGMLMMIVYSTLSSGGTLDSNPLYPLF